MNDEELQRAVESGSTPDAEGASAYRVVFNALRKEPGYVLPGAFADRVMRRIRKTESSSADVFWLIAGVTGCLVTMVVAISLTGFKFSFGALRFLSNYRGLVVFAIL